MKRGKYEWGELAPLFINKQLEKYGIDIEHVKEHQEIDGIPWYQYYTLTSIEAEEIKDWFINILETKITPKINKHRILTEFSWLNLMYGLNVEVE